MGKRFKAIDVFSMCIAALTDDMIKSGSNTVSGGLTKDDVHWVVTVPAIWSDAAKQFMREAAEMKPVRMKLTREHRKLIRNSNILKSVRITLQKATFIGNC